MTRDERLADAIDRGWREAEASDAAYARANSTTTRGIARWRRALCPRISPQPPRAAALGIPGPPMIGNTRAASSLTRSTGPARFSTSGARTGFSWRASRDGARIAIAIEPYGLDIAPELAALARRRYPRWADRIFVGNALGFRPPFFDIVRAGLEYVPPPRRRELVAWLLAHVVAPHGRLVVGKYNEELAPRAIEAELAWAGFAIAGRAERAHRTEPRICYRIVWVDA